MTIRFTGTFRYRFRLSLFGHEIFAGPWESRAIDIEEPVPCGTATIPLPDGFSASIGGGGDGVSFGLNWEGIPIVSETVPVTGSLPVNVQPLKGILLTGTVSVAGG